MARIPMTSGFSVIPEGTYIFRIYDAQYDEEFGKITIKLVDAKGRTMSERFCIKNKNDEINEKALNAFSYFAKTALGDFETEDVDPSELVNRYIEATVVHTVLPSTKDPTKSVTFAHLDDKKTAEGFNEQPTERAMSLSNNDKIKEPTATTQTPNTEQDKGLDLDALLR